ncbi:Predicted flavoprotein CzcO associated with the cation diffusion facilitator CzcD [Solimonas aquatica]|uniref:Predicted flavoprotein CzcO associated with the cation diffusion facilitator CzcD n=1 Tax=Solimonas aquatica TaxID=489703 RepID=A0A1H8ZGT7_9GAMM|nr:alpha/beta hydrolase fold domain-containing protein [Solimonas aquatica]SEP63525.1 Predicted flavoprotein CzcO associated with the cation diffusion facilitator CzcD [Solimonas aquatica]
MSAEAREAKPLGAVIIGAGFAGIGMGIALRREGLQDFLIVERAQDVGGVWRDNRYPGAACDVPSHLYSFSFEPNPDWSHVFSAQPEIAAYLQLCARKYQLLPHIRFGTAVQSARYDEAQDLWQVSLSDGSVLQSRLLISGVGQLSRPALPRIEGIDSFAGRSFHSAQWDEHYPLEGKRVAVIGTGASAIQFIPEIARQAKQLKIFQRSPAWMMPRHDRAYSEGEKRRFRQWPWLMRLYRLGIYLRYESRALAFTRFKSLMKLVVEIPYRATLKREIADPVLREKLLPDYPIGCKRLLLSDNYLETMTRANVQLLTQGIRRLTPQGVETTDGQVHEVDAIVYGTGFAATEFLAPMSISGRDGQDLNTVWRQGAMAYLGLTVPGFPNFFMLYGPNTNLGHNSIVYMLESQIAHVLRCIRRMREVSASAIDTQAATYRHYNAHIQKRLAGTVWNGCKSWYVDANGHNSTNWPGFTLSYRWLTRHGSLRPYRFSSIDARQAGSLRVAAPQNVLERASAALMRGILRSVFRPLIGPPFAPRVQRAVVDALVLAMPGRSGAQISQRSVAGRPVEILQAPGTAPRQAILYLHGGAFCLGSPRTHRSITTHLAAESGMAVWVPDYRLAPEHPCPAAVEDALACVQAMNEQGFPCERIVIAGDSAGGALTLEVALRLRDAGQRPAGLAMISPVTDAQLRGETLATHAGEDPMLRIGWLRQGLDWYLGRGGARPALIDQDFRGLPPMLIQVGSQEILLSDSLRLSERARAAGVEVRCELHEARWHVFHLQAFYLRSAVDAIAGIAAFARRVTASDT